MSKKTDRPEKNYMESVCDKVGEVAVQYGFTVIKPCAVSNDDLSRVKHFRDFDHYNDVHEKIALTRWYTDENLAGQSQPIMVHYKKPLPGSALRKKPSEEMYGLEIIGSSRATSEALLLKTAIAILGDLGYTDMCVDINSIGDRDSVVKFERDLHTYFRKNGQMLPAKLREQFKKNPYAILASTDEASEEFRKSAPQPLGSLSETGRLHFKEVLEYMEAFEVMYKIKGTAFSNKLFAAHTVFEIRATDEKNTKDGEGALLAYGYRYNYLAKKIGQKREIPAIGLTIVVKKTPEISKKITIKNIKHPRFYLVQLGATAKLKALNVVEMLRKQKIPVYHSLTKDKITGQLSGAEYVHASHVLIIGQKEAIENTVVVRSVLSREQETVALGELADFLKKLPRE